MQQQYPAHPQPIFVTTLKEANLDDSCPQKLWYAKFQRGSGIVPNTEILPNEMFEATLSDMQTVSLMQDISPGAIQEVIDGVLHGLSSQDLKNTRAMELLYRRLGWMAAYAIFVEPQIRKIYATIDIPDTTWIERESLRVNTPTSGRLLRNRQNGQVEHREFVLTGSANAKWRESWEWNIRPHLTLLAIREGLGQKIDFCRIIGLNTGFTSSVPGAQLHHPYVYGHFNKTTGEWSHLFKLTDEDGGSWVERPVWEYGLTLIEWVIKVGATVADQQFPLSPKIPLNQRVVNLWLQRRLFRERHLQSMKVTAQDNMYLRNLHFPMKTEACAPIHSAPCAFKDLCWSEPFMSAALMSQKFTPNNPLLKVEEVREIPTVTVEDSILPLAALRQTLSDRVEAAIGAGRSEVVSGFVPANDANTVQPDIIPY